MSSENKQDIEFQRAKAGFVFNEDLVPGSTLSINLNSILVSTQSPFQKIDVIDTIFGKTLVTDGKTQSAEMDEFAYHESLVHPPLFQSSLLADNADEKCGRPNGPRTVFIGGGGELATAREVLKHKSVERVVMVDLDEKVVEVCKKYLPEWGGEKVASNPRLQLIIGDAYEYLMNSAEKFDVIIMDISDPIEAGPGIMLYTQEFYEHAKSLLNFPHGVFVTQAGMAEAVPLHFLTKQRDENAEDASCYGPIANTLETVFDCVLPYSINIPSFGSDWGYVMAFNISSPEDVNSCEMAKKAFKDISPSKIDEMISTNISDIDDDNASPSANDGSEIMKFYDGETHRSMFALTKSLRRALKLDERIMTKENPVFMY